MTDDPRWSAVDRFFAAAVVTIEETGWQIGF
jgi:hypothetical protein